MKLFATITLVLASTNFIIGQASPDFMKLLEIFDEGYRTEIPEFLAEKYFDFTPNEDQNYENKELYVKGQIFKNEQFIALSAASDCGAAGICEHAELRLFNKLGMLVNKLESFEYAGADCADQSYRTCRYASDTLLIIVDEEIEKDCLTDSVISLNINFREVRITTKGTFILDDQREVDVRRRFYSASTEILNKDDFENIDKEDLSIMRNEIYAGHGYKFKTTKWMSYFNQFEWYDPRYDDVEDQITMLEKENIKSILKEEGK